MAAMELSSAKFRTKFKQRSSLSMYSRSWLTKCSALKYRSSSTLVYFLVRYLDKEAGVMVNKLLKTNEKPGEEKQANGAVQEDSEKSIATSTGHAVESESMMYFLGRTFFQVRLVQNLAQSQRLSHNISPLYLSC